MCAFNVSCRRDYKAKKLSCLSLGKITINTKVMYRLLQAITKHNQSNHRQSMHKSCLCLLYWNENMTLSQLQYEYGTFVSADYMMSKNLSYWGDSPLPARTLTNEAYLWCIWHCWPFSTKELHLPRSWVQEQRSHYLFLSTLHWYPHWQLRLQYHFLSRKCKFVKRSKFCWLG